MDTSTAANITPKKPARKPRAATSAENVTPTRDARNTGNKRVLGARRPKRLRGRVRLDEIAEGNHIAQFKAKLMTRVDEGSLKLKSVNNILAVLSKAMRYAEDQHVVEYAQRVRLAVPSVFRTTYPRRTTESPFTASSSRAVIGTLRRVRPLGVPVIPLRVCSVIDPSIGHTAASLPGISVHVPPLFREPA